MMPVAAPHFSVSECNSEAEREFLETLQARAETGGWYGDSWQWPGRVLLSVCRIEQGRVKRTLRVDFDGTAVAFGDDETHQFVTDLYLAAGATVASGRSPAELATAAADWLEAQIAGWSEQTHAPLPLPQPTKSGLPDRDGLGRIALVSAIAAWIVEGTLLLADLGWLSRAIKLDGITLAAAGVLWLAAFAGGLVALIRGRSNAGLVAVVGSLLLPVGVFCFVLLVGGS